MTFADLAKRAQKLAIDNSPGLLTGIGVAGTVMTAYLTGRASFEAAEIINLKEGVEGTCGDRRELYKERFKLVWRLYIPAATTGSLTIACVVGSNRIGSHRAAALAAAASISDRVFETYKEKVVERLGEKKESAIRDEIAQDEITKNPVSSREVIIAGGGDVLCYDSWTGRYFQSDVETLKAAQNKVNYEINQSFYASLSDFFAHIGLPSTTGSDEVGWNSDRLMELEFSTTLAENNQPCLVIGYTVTPIRGFYRVN